MSKKELKEMLPDILKVFCESSYVQRKVIIVSVGSTVFQIWSGYARQNCLYCYTVALHVLSSLDSMGQFCKHIFFR